MLLESVTLQVVTNTSNDNPDSEIYVRVVVVSDISVIPQIVTLRFVTLKSATLYPVPSWIWRLLNRSHLAIGCIIVLLIVIIDTIVSVTVVSDSLVSDTTRLGGSQI